MNILLTLTQSKGFWYAVLGISLLTGILLRFGCGFVSNKEEEYEKIDTLRFSTPGEYDRECMRISGRPCPKYDKHGLQEGGTSQFGNP